MPTLLKLGPHHLQGGSDTKAWMLLGPTVAKAVGDLGVLSEAPAGVLRVGRMTDDGQLDGQGFDANRYAGTVEPVVMAAQYTAWLTRFIDTNPWVDVWEGPNEQVITAPASMAWYGAFLYEFARLVKAKGKRAGLGGWAVGNPRRELNLWPHYVWALQAVRDHGAILTRHEYGPLDGANSLRYRADNAEFTRLGYPDLPVIISECGADDAGGMTRWRNFYHGDLDRYWNELLRPYAQALRRDAYCLGATVFTVGGGDAWHGFDVDRTGLVDRLRDYVQAPPDDLDVETPTPGPAAAWWEAWPAGEITPMRQLKAPNRRLEFFHADGTAFTPAKTVHVTWVMDVNERQGGLLRVFDQTGTDNDWYVRAEEVEPV
jgi:hypothetical protein